MPGAAQLMARSRWKILRCEGRRSEIRIMTGWLRLPLPPGAHTFAWRQSSPGCLPSHSERNQFRRGSANIRAGFYRAITVVRLDKCIQYTFIVVDGQKSAEILRRTAPGKQAQTGPAARRLPN